MTPIEAYIRQAAVIRGIDPDTAVAVARAEGGLDNPTRQSDVVKHGRREQSYGPFQLLMQGGLGEKALQAGIDPRDPNQWKQGVDFALDHVTKNGWGEWYGAKAIGVTGFDGVSKKAKPMGVSLNTPGAPSASAIAPLGSRTPAPTFQPEPTAPTAPEPAAPPPAPQGFLDKLLANKEGLDKVAGALGGKPADGGDDSLNRIDPVNFQPFQANPAAAQLLAQILANHKKRYGLSLDGM